MTGPRFRIAWFMAVVAVIALNFGVMRQWSSRSREDKTKEALMIGGLPMSNVVAVCFLIGRRRLRSHPFLLGFVVFGATVLALYVAATILFTGAWVEPYLKPVLKPLVRSFGPPLTPAETVFLYSLAAAMLDLPQLAFALVGGLVFRKFRKAERSGRTYS